MHLLWLKALHLVGAVLWMGASIAVALVAAAASGNERAPVAALARRVALRIATPGLVLAFVGGLTMLALSWDAYARAGWMHGKLLLVVIAAGLHGAVSGKLRKLSKGDDVGGLQGLAYAYLVLLALIVVAVVVGPTLLPARAG
ncbi:MAG: CopD family protein [Sandaracinus sp.]|nr:CopD family protein [Myxococcales bacterium]MCB9599955.1 CopD family protein [Sandaracinus sp.]MCB9616211.1 CopD family protein [Sandaracinus sp.]